MLLRDSYFQLQLTWLLATCLCNLSVALYLPVYFQGPTELVFCFSDFNCGLQQFCNKGACSNTLALGSTCLRHKVCSTGFCDSEVCSARPQPPPKDDSIKASSAPTPTLAADRLPCSRDDECAGGMCLQHRCRSRCDSSSPCPPLHSCLMGRCLPQRTTPNGGPCSTHEACSSGWCEGFVCAAPCDDDPAKDPRELCQPGATCVRVPNVGRFCMRNFEPAVAAQIVEALTQRDPPTSLSGDHGACRRHHHCASAYCDAGVCAPRCDAQACTSPGQSCVQVPLRGRVCLRDGADLPLADFAALAAAAELMDGTEQPDCPEGMFAVFTVSSGLTAECVPLRLAGQTCVADWECASRSCESMACTAVPGAALPPDVAADSPAADSPLTAVINATGGGAAKEHCGETLSVSGADVSGGGQAHVVGGGCGGVRIDVLVGAAESSSWQAGAASQSGGSVGSQGEVQTKQQACLESSNCPAGMYCVYTLDTGSRGLCTDKKDAGEFCAEAYECRSNVCKQFVCGDVAEAAFPTPP